MKTISIGSDCSGVGTDAVAVARLGLKFENRFSSDTCSHCRDILECFLVSTDWLMSSTLTGSCLKPQSSNDK